VSQYTTLPASEVLDRQAELTDRLKNPSAHMQDYMRYFMTDATAKDPGRSFGMFFPAVRRDELDKPITDEQGRRLAKILYQSLWDATAYQVTGEMVDAMSQVGPKKIGSTRLDPGAAKIAVRLDTGKAVPQEALGNDPGIDHLSERELPEAKGFAYFDQPWVIYDIRDDQIPVRAVSWSYESVPVDGSLSDLLPGLEPGRMASVRISMWTDIDDDYDLNPQHFRDSEHPEKTKQALGNLSLLHTALVPFFLRFSKDDDDKSTARSASIITMVHVLWMFLGMEIVSTEPAHLDRHARKRALRSLKHNEVHVVMLRRVNYHGDAPGMVRNIDWSVRWIVQGHLRHLEHYEGPHHRAVAAGTDKHCVVCGSRTAWIAPYIKGPDGKPLQVSRQLMRLAR
jgi:hypothetical protein